MYFKEIIGHKQIVENLINTVKSGKISHAYIFDGSDGVGKEKTAKTFAHAILCEGFNGEPCRECKSCHLTFGDSHPDLKVLDLTYDENGVKKASIAVERIRELKKDVYLKPFFSDRKIYILKNAELMTVEAQNAMLQIFEEPPSYITIILICNGISKILSTIKSRAVIYKFSNLLPCELEKFLNTYYNEEEQKKIYSHISSGSISKMLELISDEESLIYREKILKAFLKIITSPLKTSVNELYGIFMKNKDDKNYIIELLSLFIFDMVYIKTKNNERIVNIDYEETLNKAASNITLKNIYSIEKILATLSEQISKNANYKLAVINALIKITEEIYD